MTCASTSAAKKAFSVEIPPSAAEEPIVSEIQKACQAIFAYTNRLWLIRAHLVLADARFKSLDKGQSWEYRICVKFPCPHTRCDYPKTSFAEDCYLAPLCENVRQFAEKTLKAEIQLPFLFKAQLDTLTTVLSYERTGDVVSLTNAQKLHEYLTPRRPRLFTDLLDLRRIFAAQYQNEPSEFTPEEASALERNSSSLRVRRPPSPLNPYSNFDFDYPYD